MKNYEQMAEDVLRRSEEYTIERKKTRKVVTSIAAFGCLALLIVVNSIVLAAKTMDESPSLIPPSIQMDHHATEGTKETETTQPQGETPIIVPGGDAFGDSGIVLLVARTTTAYGTPLENDLELPLNYSLRVRDFRGLSAKERLQAELEERALHAAKMKEGLGGASMKLGNCTNRDDYMISFVRTGCFRLLWIKDHASVESISIKSTTVYGKVDVCLSNSTYPNGQEVTLLPEEIPEWDWENGLRINWKYSNEVLNILDEDPATPLSTFSDKVVFTVNFVDGATQECAVRILVQDDGEVVACLQDSISDV